MARKDDILISFLEHDILKEKYGLTPEELPVTVRDALKSNVPIIKAIAMIVDSLEGSTPITDKVLHNTITQLLNTSAV